MHRYFDEKQVYRIEHYLGEKTVQNLLAFRSGNAMFESARNRDHIQSVQIGVAEAVFDAHAIRLEKVKVLRSVASIRDDAVMFGQYAPGKKGRKKLPGYRQETGVAARSRVETFVELRLEIDNWRSQGVPFQLYTGKRLARQATGITINFRHHPGRRWSCRRRPT